VPQVLEIGEFDVHLAARPIYLYHGHYIFRQVQLFENPFMDVKN
jgi:hypothetical protein